MGETVWLEAKETPTPERERRQQQVYKGVGLGAAGFIYLCNSAPPTVLSTYWEVMTVKRGDNPTKAGGVTNYFLLLNYVRPIVRSPLESTQFAEQVITI